MTTVIMTGFTHTMTTVTMTTIVMTTVTITSRTTTVITNDYHLIARWLETMTVAVIVTPT